MAAVGEALGRALPPQAPPPGLRDRVLARATAPAVEDRASRNTARHARGPSYGWLAAAAALVAAVTSVMAWQYREEAARARIEQQETARASAIARTADRRTSGRRHRPRHKHARCWPLAIWLALNCRASRPRLVPRAGCSGARPTAWCSPRPTCRRFRPDAFTNCGWLRRRRSAPASASRRAAASSASSRRRRRRRGRRRLRSPSSRRAGVPPQPARCSCSVPTELRARFTSRGVRIGSSAPAVPPERASRDPDRPEPQVRPRPCRPAARIAGAPALRCPACPAGS